MEKKVVAELNPSYDGTPEALRIVQVNYIEDGEKEEKLYVEFCDKFGKVYSFDIFDSPLKRFTNDILKMIK